MILVAKNYMYAFVRVVEKPYANSRNGLCDYSKWVVRLFEMPLATIRQFSVYTSPIVNSSGCLPLKSL